MNRCYQSCGQVEVMPLPEKAHHTFEDWSKMLSPPFSMYADIECLLPDNGTDKYLQKHQPIAVGLYLTCNIQQNSIPVNSFR